MKKLLLVLSLLVSAVAVHGQDRRPERIEQVAAPLQEQTQVPKQIPVALTFYVCDMNGFPLIFQDRFGRLTAVEDLQKDYVFKRNADKYDPEITILYDEKISDFRSAENPAEHAMEANAKTVFKKPYSEIIEYRRTRIE